MSATGQAEPPIPGRPAPPLPRPSRRPLQIYALDPMRLEGLDAGFVTPRATLAVPYEELLPGPIGERIRVVDYDGSRNVFFEPVDLDDPHLLVTNGITPTETDPRFHQQMVYAVAASTWDEFEGAMGRRIGLSGGPLHIFPHAFYGENAYYDPTIKALLFGYFQADERDPGPNLPGQWVFTCLSHDVIVHETTHALVDRLRPLFNEDTNPDVLAFHEAFADLVAIFQHFKIRDVLIDAINVHKADVTNADAISSLARQFGFATAQRSALRTAIDTAPDPGVLARTTESHARGVILVQAVFDAYRSTYLARVQDLLRIASGGTGILQEGRPHPDLVNRLASEAADTAHLFFTRCVQAFTYLPVLDVTFADFLRALVTVDTIAAPTDDSFRISIIEAFRRRGIYAGDAGSLGDNAVALAAGAVSEPLPDAVHELLLQTATDRGEYRHRSDEEKTAEAAIVTALKRWARAHADELGLVEHGDTTKVDIEGFHSTVRLDQNGQPWVDTVVQVVQQRVDLAERRPAFDGIVPKAATTVVADARGAVRYLITKPLPDVDGTATPSRFDARGRQRFDRLVAHIDATDRHDATSAYAANRANRLRVNFGRLHGGYDRRDTQ